LERIDILKRILYGTEVIACVSGFICWKKIKHTHWKYFPIYLALIVAIEIVGEFFSRQQLYSSNLALYNYFGIPLEILFFIWLFHKVFATTTLRKLTIAAACIYIGCWATEMFFIPKLPSFWIGSFSYTVGILLLLVLILTYLYQLVTSSEIIFIKSNMMFWVCMGLFVFYTFSLPFYGMGNYLYNHHSNIYFIYSQAIYVLNYIMYGLFIIAFIWGKPKSLFL
jgi:hypothetical protein